MFFSDAILTRKGPLATIWMAAHWERRLTRAQVVGADICATVRDVLADGIGAMALRLSGQLLLGAARIYGRKARYLLEDCSEALERLRSAFAAAVDDHGASSGAAETSAAARAAPAAITLPSHSIASEPEPELDLEALLRGQTAPILRVSAPLQLGALGFGLETMRDSDVPSELHPVPTEAARFSLAGGPSPMAVEVGRRASSLASAPVSELPYSPLRASHSTVGGGLGVEAENPFLDAEDAFDADVPRVSLEPLVVPDLPQTPAVGLARRKAAAKPVSRPRRRRPVVLDETTELDAAVVQRQVAQTAAIVTSEADMAEKALGDDVLGAAMDGLSLAGAGRLSAEAPPSILGSELDVPRTPARSTREPLAKSPRVDSSVGGGTEDDRMADEAPLDYGADMADSVRAPESPVPSESDDATRLAGRDADTALATWAPLFVGPRRSSARALPFGALVARPGTRRHAAEAFVHLLALHTRGALVATQDEPFGPISVSLVRA